MSSIRRSQHRAQPGTLRASQSPPCTESTAPRPHHRDEEIPMHAQSTTCPSHTRTARRRLAPAIGPRYGSRVTVNPVADLGRSSSNRRTSAHHPIAGAFFASAMSRYGGCARDTFGCAGFLFPGRPTCAQLSPSLAWPRAVAAPHQKRSCTHEARPRPQSVRTA